MGLINYIKTKIIIAGINHKRKTHPFLLEEFEKHQLPEDASPLLNNSYYFGGNNTQGESLIFRFAFRKHLSEAFILYTKDKKFYVIEQQEFAADQCPIKVECLEPGKLWRCVFNGKMKDTETGEVFDSSFDVTYTARLPIFDSLYHADSTGMAKAFAREKWNKRFFAEAMSSDMGMASAIDRDKNPDQIKEEQRRNEQHHYEQTGWMKGSITIGADTHSVDLGSVRDHSFGKRDWNFMNNHIWLMAITDEGQTMNLQLVNYPRVKRIYVGYTDLHEDRNYSLVDYQILEYDHNDGLGSDVIRVDMTFNNGKTYHVKATREVNLLTPFDGGNFYFQEGIANFDINGTPARGTIEYGFNKDRSRWDSYDNH